MERNGEFHNAQSAAEMAPGFGCRSNDFGAEFACKPGQFIRFEFPERFRSRGLIEQRCQSVHTQNCNTRLTVRQDTIAGESSSRDQLCSRLALAVMGSLEASPGIEPGCKDLQSSA